MSIGSFRLQIAERSSALASSCDASSAADEPHDLELRAVAHLRWPANPACGRSRGSVPPPRATGRSPAKPAADPRSGPPERVAARHLQQFQSSLFQQLSIAASLTPRFDRSLYSNGYGSTSIAESVAASSPTARQRKHADYLSRNLLPRPGADRHCDRGGRRPDRRSRRCWASACKSPLKDTPYESGMAPVGSRAGTLQRQVLPGGDDLHPVRHRSRVPVSRGRWCTAS